MPQRMAQLGVATLFPVTPAETLSILDVGAITDLLYRYATGGMAAGGIGGGRGGGTGGCGPPLPPALGGRHGAPGAEAAGPKPVVTWPTTSCRPHGHTPPRPAASQAGR